jgi:hypothetical protein
MTTRKYILATIFTIIALFLLICRLSNYEGKMTAKQYREQYREQGRRQVRVEAVQAGVAEIIDGDFRWLTNNVHDTKIELKDLLEELIRRRKGDAKVKVKVKEESGSKEDGQKEGNDEGSVEEENENQEEVSGPGPDPEKTEEAEKR